MPGPGLSEDRFSVAWLRQFLAGHDIALDDEPEGVLSLTSSSPGFGEVIEFHEDSEGRSRDRLTVKPFPVAPIPVERYPHLNEAPLPTKVTVQDTAPKPRSLALAASLVSEQSRAAEAVGRPAPAAPVHQNTEHERPDHRNPDHGNSDRRNSDHQGIAQPMDGPLVWDRSRAAS